MFIATDKVFYCTSAAFKRMVPSFMEESENLENIYLVKCLHSIDES